MQRMEPISGPSPYSVFSWDDGIRLLADQLDAMAEQIPLEVTLEEAQREQLAVNIQALDIYFERAEFLAIHMS
jgi:hypothetical protein